MNDIDRPLSRMEAWEQDEILLKLSNHIENILKIHTINESIINNVSQTGNDDSSSLLPSIAPNKDIISIKDNDLINLSSFKRLFVWHPQIHEKWEHENLYFWRIAFSTIYDRKSVLDALELLFQQLSIHSYVIYELTGIYDLMLRIWQPSSLSQDEFEGKLSEALTSLDLGYFQAQAFHATHTDINWLWEDGYGGMSSPNSNDLSRRLPDRIIHKINSGQWDDEISRYKNKKLISECKPSPGIKFFIAIPSPGIEMSITQRNEFRGRLIDTLMKAKPHIMEVSLYTGPYGSSFAQYLISGRVENGFYNDITNKISEFICAPTGFYHLGRALRFRTHTYICALENVLTDREHLPLLSPIDPQEKTANVELLLKQDESQLLEVKGSAFVDIGKWLFSEINEIVESDKIIEEGILKAIVGMLNADGGQIVIGAIEAKQFNKPRQIEKLSQYPRCGGYYCLGLNFDYQGNDWDWFERHLRSIIESRISPNPKFYIRIQKAFFSGQNVCLLSVDPDLSGIYYYAVEKATKYYRFYVRLGNQTRELPGPEGEDYREKRKKS